MCFSCGGCAPKLYNMHFPQEPTLSTAHTALPASITLWTPLHQRLRAATTDLVGRLRHALRQAAEQRVAKRQARQQHALLSHLDAHTLRDIGLGDWAASARDSDDASSRRALELRGF